MRELTFFNVLDGVSIRSDRLFLKISDKAVAGRRRKQVGDEHGVEENALCAYHHNPHEDPRFCH